MNNKEFTDAVAKSKTLTEKPSNDILLKLYALYKQASDGDVNVERPGGFDFKGVAKFDAWEQNKGMTKENAANKYIELVNSLF